MSIFAAIDQGDVEMARALLAADPSAAAGRDNQGISAVLAASYRGLTDIRDAILEVDPPLDIFDAAAVNATDQIADLLGGDGSLANAVASDGFTPLQLAAFFGQSEAARLLIAAGADPNAVARNAMAIQPLHAAAASRSADVVELLIDAGADVNGRQHGDWTPLMAAADQGDEMVLDLLLAAGADPSQTNDGGQTALLLAEAKGHDAIRDRLRGAA